MHIMLLTMVKHTPHLHSYHEYIRQNKLETPKEKDEVNKRGVHECDVGTLDPETMVVPPTPKSTYKVGTLVRVMSTITSKETL